jgi:hypothetical protein
MIIHKVQTYEFLLPASLALAFGPAESNALESLNPAIIERGALPFNTVLLLHALLLHRQRTNELREFTREQCTVMCNANKGRTNLIHPDSKAGVWFIILWYVTMTMQLLKLELKKEEMGQY